MIRLERVRESIDGGPVLQLWFRSCPITASIQSTRTNPILCVAQIVTCDSDQEAVERLAPQ
jgi:hypothetical protein